MKSVIQALEVPTTAIAGAAFDVQSLREMNLQVAGVTASVVAIEATIDGTTWVAILSSVASGFHAIAGTYKALRAHTTSIGGGETVTATLIGRDSRTE